MTSTVTTNPIILAVAERLYRMVRTRDRRIAPVNVASDLSARRAEAADRAAEKDTFDQLTDDQKAGWCREAEQLVEPLLTAAARAYSRSGAVIDADVLDHATWESAQKIGFRFREWRAAWRASREDRIEFPIYAVDAGLAAVAALRAAFGWNPTQTAPEIVDERRNGHEKQTPAGDELRLHLASAHGYPIAFGAGDDEAEDLHVQMHNDDEGRYAHHRTNLEWTDEEVQDAIAKTGLPSAQFDRPYAEHLERAPHTVAYDKLRLHLVSAHCLINAAQLRDHEVVDAHEHEHNGPGTIRNHPREDRTWNLDKVSAVPDDVRSEPDLYVQYREATNAVMTRLKGSTP